MRMCRRNHSQSEWIHGDPCIWWINKYGGWFDQFSFHSATWCGDRRESVGGILFSNFLISVQLLMCVSSYMYFFLHSMMLIITFTAAGLLIHLFKTLGRFWDIQWIERTSHIFFPSVMLFSRKTSCKRTSHSSCVSKTCKLTGSNYRYLDWFFSLHYFMKSSS